MCVARTLSPPTATAMSYRSVELVTTLSCAAAGALTKSAAPATRVRMCIRLLLPEGVASVASGASERMRLVRADREGRLQQDAIRGDRAARQIPLGALERGVDLRELAREPLEIHRAGAKGLAVE